MQPQKGTTLRGSLLYDVQIVKTGQMVAEI